MTPVAGVVTPARMPASSRGRSESARECMIPGPRHHRSPQGFAGAALTVVIAAATLLPVPGCATLPNGRAWGGDVTVRPGWGRVGTALENAATSPTTWVPVACAAIFRVEDWDQRASRWCAEKTPVFGSRKAAATASTDLLRITQGAYLLTCLATPSGRDPKDWILQKSAATLLGFAAIEATKHATDLGKIATMRVRPDRSDDRSFPSGHASGAAVRATLASRNARAIFPDRGAGEPGGECGARLACDAASGMLAVGCAWARLEAYKHYPSDVLVGLALGHLVGSFVNDAFITPRGAGTAALGFAPRKGGFEVTVRFVL